MLFKLVAIFYFRLGYVTAADVIELKGRVACELSRLVKATLWKFYDDDDYWRPRDYFRYFWSFWRVMK